MKSKKNILIIISLFFLIGGMGCEKEEILPKNQAQGKVLFVTGPCQGYMVFIEVDNPKGIGKKGTYTINRSSPTEEVLEYGNVISTPYFNRINLPAELMKEGTWLHFEYREVTEEDINNGLLEGLSVICPQIWGTPPSTSYIITKIITHKP